MKKVIKILVLFIGIFSSLVYGQEVNTIKVGENGFGINWELREYQDSEQHIIYIALPFFDTSDSLNVKEIQILNRYDLILFCDILLKKGNEINYSGSTQQFNNYELSTICSISDHNHASSKYIWLKSEAGETSVIDKESAIKLAYELLKYKDEIVITNETLY